MRWTKRMQECRVCLIAKHDKEVFPVDEGQVDRALNNTCCSRMRVGWCYFSFIAFDFHHR